MSIVTGRRAYPYMLVRLEKTNGTGGGTTSTGDNLVPYTNTYFNTIGGASMSSSLITLPAGTYQFRARQNRNAGGGTAQLRLYNNTDSADIWVGDSGNDPSAGSDTPVSISGQFTITSTKVVKMLLWVSLGVATNGFGAAATGGKTEVHGTCEFWKVG